MSDKDQTPPPPPPAAKKVIKAAPPKVNPAVAALKATVAAPKMAKVTPPAAAKTIPVNPAAALALKALEKMTKGTLKPIKANRAPLPCVSTGSLAIDNLIGGNPAADGTGPICMGFPRGHISEVYGAEASGKTTLALSAIAQVLRQGGSAMFLDFEHALNHKYAEQIGVTLDTPNFINVQPESLEQGMELLKMGALAGMDIIVVDSVAAMVPEADKDKKFTEADQIGGRARKLASILPRIVKVLHTPSKHNKEPAAIVLINQTRANISPNAGAAVNTSGGYALKFFAYLRLMATRIRSEYIEIKDPLTHKPQKRPYGNHTQVKVIKSKVDAKQGHTCDIFIRFGHGIDDYYSMIETGVAHKVVKKGGAFFEFEGHRFQGREQFRKFLMENAQVFQALQAQVLGAIRRQAEDVEMPEEEVDDLLSSIQASEEEDPEASPSEEPDEVSLDDIDEA